MVDQWVYGPIKLAGDPTDDLHVATKQYVDNKVPPAPPDEVVIQTSSPAPGSVDLWVDFSDNTAMPVASEAYVNARTPKITVATSAPSSPSVGDLWVNST
jgi:hypothetical protein